MQVRDRDLIYTKFIQMIRIQSIINKIMKFVETIYNLKEKITNLC